MYYAVLALISKMWYNFNATEMTKQIKKIVASNKATSGEGGFDKNTLRVVFYIIEKLNGVLGKTHLMKLLFLADLMAMKKFKEKITTVNYKRYTYGPFSPEVDNYTRRLEKMGLIEIRTMPLDYDPSKTYTRFYLQKKVSVKPLLMKNIGADKVMLLDEVIESYGNMGLQNLLDIVYELQIMKESEMNKPLDMAKEIVEDVDTAREAEADIF